MRWVWERLKKLRMMLHELRQRLPAPVKRVIRRIGRITAGTLAWIVAGIAAVFVAAHFWLPTLAERKGEIENYLTGAIGNPVKLGELETFWDGLNPGLRVEDLRILTVAGEPALRLRAAQLSLSWRALLFGNVEINHLTLIGPQLTVERLHNGKLRITGLASQTPTPDALPDFSAWLLRQREIMIVDGVLDWVDRGAPAGRDMVETMTIRSVQASVRNDGARHAFSLRATFPERVCSACQVTGDIEGNPLLDEDWSGEIRVQGRKMDLQHLPGVLRQHLPAKLTGQVGATLTGHWQAARLTEITGQLSLEDFSVPVGERGDALALRRLVTGLYWRGEAERWRLQLESLRLAHTGSVWQAGRLEIDARPDQGQITVEHVNLAEAAGFLAGWSQARGLHAWLADAKPAGWLHQLRLSWSGKPLAPESYRLETQVSGFQAQAAGKVPGVTSLSGKLVATPEEGEFRIDSHNGRLDLPRVMHETIPYARLAGRVRWQREAEDWRVQAAALELRNADARLEGEVELRFPHDSRQSPHLNLEVTLRDGHGESVERYFPRVTPERLRAYLTRAIQGGRVTRATVVMQGALADFPYRHGNGKFEVRAQVRNGQLEFLEGWTPLRNLDVDMRFTGTGMLLTARSGSLRGLHVSRVAVEIEDFLAPQGVLLTVRGHASGAVADAVAVLRDSKHPPFRAWLSPGLNASGQGVLDLDLRIPLKTSPAPEIEGEYRIAGGRLAFTAAQPPIEGMQGMLGFNHHGLHYGKLGARWLGSELAFMAAAEGSDGTDVQVRGAIAEKILPDLLGPALARQVNGPVPWQLQWRSAAGRNDLTLQADLRELEINLPAPLAKARGDALQLEARSAGPVGGALLFDLQTGERAAGKLVWQRSDGEWKLQRGRIALGERTAATPVQDGLHLSARLPELNVDRWWPALQPAWESSRGEPGPSLINRVSVDVATLYFLDRPFGRLSLDVTRGPGYWSGRVDGDSISGQGLITLPGAGGEKEHAGLQLSLARFAVPLASPGARAGSLDPRRLPALQIRSDSFRYAQYDFGALDFSAEPSFAGWRITSVKMARPETTLKASGQWLINRLGKQSSQFDVEMESSDFGRTLGEFGYGEELVGGKLRLQSEWNWVGAPGDFSLASLNGKFGVDLKDGRLPSISPGAGRLFGALDLRSVTRILTFDFSTVFAKGLTFDKLQGLLEVNSGNAYTRNLAIQVPGADIELRGRIGLVSRDLDMTMDVTPRVSANLAPVIGGTILGGPLVGGAIAVIGGVTRKPFEKSARTEYTVKGEWGDPKVVTVRAPVAAETESAP
jgi:uncharacterized protein (TIGR02099 family)